MTYSPRTFILGPDDTIYRLASAKFSRMVDDPESHRLERFAGQRVRMAEAIVEVRDRAPYAVVRLIYEMLGFDAEGRLDRATFIRQNAALAELAVSRVIPRPEAKETAVVEAGSRFVARGGSWKPTPAQEREILRAALEETPCKRL
jgi:hypothetical protein